MSGYVALGRVIYCAYFHIILPIYYVFYEKNTNQTRVGYATIILNEVSFSIVLLMAITIYYFVMRSQRFSRLAELS